MCEEMTVWEKAIEFHGHICPGLAIGFQAAQIALEHLKEERAADEELVAVVENDACGVDGVQVVTGCTVGKGNLVFRDIGKQAFNFVLRRSGSGLRVALKYDTLNNEEQARLREKVFGGQATGDEKARFQKLQQEAALAILDAPEEKYFTVRQISMQLPGKARIYPTRQCAFCGEGVMEPRARVRDGAVCCLDCADRYRTRLLALD